MPDANNKAANLDAAVRAVCPDISGISVGRWSDRATWRVDFGPTATTAQRSAAADVVATFDPDAVTWAQIREKRNALLAATDWVIKTDTAASTQTQGAFETYRQALRDITQAYSTPGAVIWPDPPSYQKGTANPSMIA